MSGGLADAVDGLLEASVVGSFTKLGAVLRARLEGWSPPGSVEGRVVVVTGATSGIGLAVARRLVVDGAFVHVVGRSPAKVAAVTEELGYLGTVVGHVADLSSVRATRALGDELAADLEQVDVLIGNAGALLSERTLTSEGVEVTIATHLLSPIVLADRLQAQLAASPVGRVVCMTSGGMYTEAFDLDHLEMGEADYRGTVAYARAKRAQVVWVVGAQRTSTGIDYHLVHPGWTDTPGVDAALPGFARVTGPLLRTPDQGAADLRWLAGGAPHEPTGGELWLDRRARPRYRLARTRMDEAAEAAAYDALMAWVARRVDEALNHGA